MKNKRSLFVLLIFLLTFVLSLFPTTSLADSSISTYSPHCILMEASTGKIIYEKDAYTKVAPASTTKIMTAILTLEHCELTDTATVSHNAIYSVPLRLCSCLPKRRRSSNNRTITTCTFNTFC